MLGCACQGQRNPHVTMSVHLFSLASCFSSHPWLGGKILAASVLEVGVRALVTNIVLLPASITSLKS